MEENGLARPWVACPVTGWPPNRLPRAALLRILQELVPLIKRYHQAGQALGFHRHRFNILIQDEFNPQSIILRLPPMPDHDLENPIDGGLTGLADELFDSLAAQFPVCMASDEFHFFPQARAGAVDWSRWDDFSPPAVAHIIGQLAQWERRIGPPPLVPIVVDPNHRCRDAAPGCPNAARTTRTGQSG